MNAEILSSLENRACVQKVFYIKCSYKISCVVCIHIVSFIYKGVTQLKYQKQCADLTKNYRRGPRDMFAGGWGGCGVQCIFWQIYKVNLKNFNFSWGESLHSPFPWAPGPPLDPQICVHFIKGSHRISCIMHRMCLLSIKGSHN